MRLGVLRSYVNHTIDETSEEVSSVFAATLDKFKKQGAQLIDVGDPSFHPTSLSGAEVALYEFQESINSYLSSPTRQFCPKNLAEIISSKLIDPVAVGPLWNNNILHLSTSSPEYYIRLHRISKLKTSLTKMFSKDSLDGLIYPHQTILPVKLGEPIQLGRNGLLSSLTGVPGIVITMGNAGALESARVGVPIGMEVVGLWGDDWKVIGLAEIIEGLLNARIEPALDAE